MQHLIQLLDVIVTLILKQQVCFDLSRITTTNYNVQNEGASTSRPLFFDDNDYFYWDDYIS
jgi:hypothetical protein